jgi:hypothetical protein
MLAVMLAAEVREEAESFCTEEDDDRDSVVVADGDVMEVIDVETGKD